MKNIAKCKLCKSVIESFHATDYVVCKCGEIFVDGGTSFRCGANNWENFLRVDDNGNEVLVKIEDKNNLPEINSKPTKKDLLNMLDEMIASYERFPQQAMNSPITHYDLLSALLVLSSIFKVDLKDES
jgi:hypothetical protein